MVNHSIWFVDGEGEHSNTIEAKWRGLRRVIPPNSRNAHRLPMFLVENMWRKKHANDLWGGLMGALRRVKY